MKIKLVFLFLFFDFLFSFYIVQAGDLTGGRYDVSDYDVTFVEPSTPSGGGYSVEVGYQGPTWDISGVGGEDEEETSGDIVELPEGSIPSAPEEEAEEEPTEEEKKVEEKEASEEAEEIIGVVEEVEEEKEEEEEEEEEEEKAEEEKELEEEAPQEPEMFEEGLGPNYSITPAPFGRIEVTSKKSGKKTICIVVDGIVDIIDFLKAKFPKTDITKFRLVVAPITEIVEPFWLVKIKVGKISYLAYVLFKEVSSVLEKLNTTKVHALAMYSVRPEFNSEYDVLALSIPVEKGKGYSEEGIFTAKKELIELLFAEAVSLREVINENERQLRDAVIFEILMALIPKKYHRLFEEEKPLIKKLIFIIKKHSLITLFAVILIIAIIILFIKFLKS